MLSKTAEVLALDLEMRGWVHGFRLGSVLRAFGTCAERVLILGKYLKLDTITDVKITGYINHRTLQGVLQ